MAEKPILTTSPKNPIVFWTRDGYMEMRLQNKIEECNCDAHAELGELLCYSNDVIDWWFYDHAVFYNKN